MPWLLVIPPYLLAVVLLCALWHVFITWRRVK